jgi:hypothetical protein
MPRPVLLLDIDGVINGHPQRCGWNRPPHRIKVGLPVHYEPQVVDRLRALRDVVELRWCTTWCGLPVLQVLEDRLDLCLPRAFEHRPMSKTWGDMKVEAAMAVLAEGRRVIWVDDEEAAAGRRLFPEIARAEREGRALLVCPESELGLQPEHLDAIKAFAGEKTKVA